MDCQPRRPAHGDLVRRGHVSPSLDDATLALAIGANAAIFSVVKPVLLDPGPFPHADRLVHIGGAAPGTEQPEEFGVADELYFEYRESVPAIEDAALYGTN